MTDAIAVFEGLISENTEYGDFSVTAAGEPYFDELCDFLVGGYDLSIPELGIDFKVMAKRKEVTDHYESKLFYNHVVEFEDKCTGKLHCAETEVYKAIDASYRGISISEMSKKVAKGAGKDVKSAKAKKPEVPAETAKAIVDLLGSFFETSGRDVLVDHDKPGGEAVADLLLYSTSTGDAAEIGGYRFVVENREEEITSESDGWSEGTEEITLKEQTTHAEIVVFKSLFLGQDTETSGIRISCGNASFELDAE